MVNDIHLTSWENAVLDGVLRDILDAADNAPVLLKKSIVFNVLFVLMTKWKIPYVQS